MCILKINFVCLKENLEMYAYPTLAQTVLIELVVSEWKVVGHLPQLGCTGCVP